MKRVITICAAVLLTVASWAAVGPQIPQKMSYQAVIRDGGEALIKNQQVGMKISILQGSQTGTAVYVETQTATTNTNGLVSLKIGDGTVVTGNFSTINWASGSYYIKTETDPTGGTDYVIIGTSELMSVPYALYSSGVPYNGASYNVNLGANSLTANSITAGAVTYPNAHGSSGQVLSTSGSGTLSWTTPDSISIGTIAGSSNAKGATVTSGVLNLTPADGTNGGIVTTGTQTFAGNKTVNGNLTVDLYSISGPEAIDVNNTSGAITGTMGSTQWQSFVAGQTGVLTKIAIMGNGGYGTRTGTLTIFTGSGIGGTQLSTQSVALPPNNGLFDLVLSSTVNVVQGQTYTFEITDSSGGSFLATDTALSGTSYYSNSYGLNPGWSLAFNTLVIPGTRSGNITAGGTITAGAVTYPNAHGTSGQVLSTNGSGALSWTTPSTTATAYSGILPVTNGGTGTTTSTGSGNVVLSSSPTLTGKITAASQTLSGTLGVGTASPAASSILEVSSTTQGLLPPRMTTSQRDAIGSPATGLVIFNTTTNGLEFKSSSGWVSLTTSTTSTTAAFLPTIVIGTQQWMRENLDVLTYRNGDIIPQVTDPTAWAALTTGAWCYYNNDVANGAIYGKLYNWYAVNDPRGLAPTGWHVPTDDEWTTLSTTLGGDAVAGGKMKVAGTTRWTTPNTGATNESGFAGLPGGYRNLGGSFIGVGFIGYWWSSTVLNASNAWNRFLYYTNGIIYRDNDLKDYGFSVRCLRD